MKKVLGILKIYGIISFGALVAALGLGLFLSPANMVAGGLSGLGIMMHRIFGVPVGTFMLLANIPLFWLGYRFLGSGFLLRSCVGALFFSVLTDIVALCPPITQSPLLCAIFGGGLLGLGMGMIFLVSATTGGTDIAAQLLHKFLPYIEVGKWIFVLDAFIILLSGLVFGNWEDCLYGIIAAILGSFSVDAVLQGANFAKVVYIVSPHADSIAGEILQKLSRGVTGLYAKGMYSGDKNLMLMCVIRRHEIVKLEQIVLRHDAKAFIIFSGARMVVGEGFKTYSTN